MRPSPVGFAYDTEVDVPRTLRALRPAKWPLTDRRIDAHQG